MNKSRHIVVLMLCALSFIEAQAQVLYEVSGRSSKQKSYEEVPGFQEFELTRGRKYHFAEDYHRDSDYPVVQQHIMKKLMRKQK